MTAAEWFLEILLVVLLAASLMHAVRLGRALTALRRDRARLEALLDGFNDSTRLAEEGIERLRLAAEGAGRHLTRQIERASMLREDLNLLVGRADKSADTLERTVRERRLIESEAQVFTREAVTNGSAVNRASQMLKPVERPASSEPRVRSKAERDLLRALQMSR